MKTTFAGTALISALVLGMAGCATVSKEEFAQLQNDVRAATTKADDAKKVATDANTTAQDAKRTADQAVSTANEAKNMARDAQSQAAEAKATATEAKSIATDTAEKTERMFKKSMSK